MSSRVIIILASVLLCGCVPDTDTVLHETKNSRVTVSRIGVFADDLAYQKMRGIYIITDAKTGREYIGISGVGVSELASHSEGNKVMCDER